MEKRDQLLQHKKGVSEIVSYTLLIIIAVIAALLVYEFLKLFTPKNNPLCPDGISLILEDYSCYANVSSSPANLTLMLFNKGRFNITAAYVRVQQEGRQTKTWINPESTDKFNFAPSLAPNNNVTQFYNLSSLGNKNPITSARNYILEIQPAVYDKITNKISACEEATISQTIECK